MPLFYYECVCRCFNDFISFFSSQGQVEAHVMLQTIPPEDAEFYVALQGSRLTHVTAAKRGDDGLTLSFTVPGKVLLSAFFFLKRQLNFTFCFTSSSSHHYRLSLSLP